MAFSNSIPVEKAMTMSLDEIIKETNIYVAPKRGGNKHLREEFRDNLLESNFKDQGRKKYDSDNEDEDIKFNPNDLRETLDDMMGDVNIDDDNIPFKQNSQQWRLQQPNNSAQRPLGMAPIIPQMDPYDPIERPRNYANFKHFRNNRRNNNNNNQNNMRRNFNNTQNNNFNRNNINRYNNNNRNNNNNFSRNDNFLKEQIRNISLNNRNANNNNFTVTSQLSLTSPSAQLAEAQNILARSNITKNDMGTIAGTLMALLRESAPVPHGPKYDMDVQKEIHAIQKKPLFYKQSKTGCGGEVISSDGVGIDDDMKFTPSATSTSINQRFS